MSYDPWPPEPEWEDEPETSIDRDLIADTATEQIVRLLGSSSLHEAILVRRIVNTAIEDANPAPDDWQFPGSREP